MTAEEEQLDTSLRAKASLSESLRRRCSPKSEPLLDAVKKFWAEDHLLSTHILKSRARSLIDTCSRALGPGANQWEGEELPRACAHSICK